MTELQNRSVAADAAAVRVNLSAPGLYDAILDGRKKLLHSSENDQSKMLPQQLNIALIQQIYLELTTKPTIPIYGIDLSFANNVWDFTDRYKEGKTISNYRFDFEHIGNKILKITEYMRTVLKLYALYVITEDGLDCSTNQKKILEVKKYMQYLVDKKFLYIEETTLEILKNYMSRDNILYRTQIADRRYVQKFLIFYSFLTGHNIYTKEINEWFTDIDTDRINSHIKEAKTPCPPSEFYRKYTEYHFTRVFDESVRLFERGLSGLLYIGSQTGLRGSELAILTEDSLEVIRIDKKGKLTRIARGELDQIVCDTFDQKIIGILNYRATKNGGRRGNVYTWGKTNASRKVIQVFLELRKIFATDRKVHKTNALVPNEDSKYRHRAPYKPFIQESKLQAYNKISCIKNATNFGLINTPESSLFGGSITYTSDNYRLVNKLGYSLSIMQEGGVSLGQTVSYITVKQFRVYVASDYHARGVDDRTISYLFNHHSTEMWGYYVREKHPIQEDIDFSREIVTDVVVDHTKIIGPKGEAYEKRIDEIIRNKNLNVMTDVAEVIEAVCGEMPIRAKAGGFCMKTNVDRDCWYDGVTDEFMCMYGLCPNHCRMYFMAPVALKKARSIAEEIDYNLLCEFTNAAEKEAYKLQACIENELLPEMHEMERELSDHGDEWIIKRHPKMEALIHERENIYEEINKWKKQIQQLLTSGN